MTKNAAQPMAPEPLEAALTGADDRLRLNHWMPPQAGIVPRIRIGQRWVSVLWGLPIGTTALIFLIAAAQRVEHYEMAGYGTVRTFALHLKMKGIAKLLAETLAEEEETDEKLTELAETNINQAAL